MAHTENTAASAPSVTAYLPHIICGLLDIIFAHRSTTAAYVWSSDLPRVDYGPSIGSADLQPLSMAKRRRLATNCRGFRRSAVVLMGPGGWPGSAVRLHVGPAGLCIRTRGPAGGGPVASRVPAGFSGTLRAGAMCHCGLQVVPHATSVCFRNLWSGPTNLGSAVLSRRRKRIDCHYSIGKSHL